MSCTAYAVVATVEAALAKTINKFYNFSESELFLCRWAASSSSPLCFLPWLLLVLV
jgi:hypothetical protein